MKQWWVAAAIGCVVTTSLAAAPREEGHDEAMAPVAFRGPLHLEEAVRLAVSHHPSIDASRAIARAADAQVRAVRSSQRLGITAANYFTKGNAPLAFSAPSPA